MKKEKESKQAILEQGVASDFWGIIAEELENQIVKLRREKDTQDLSNLSAEQYKFKTESSKLKIELLVMLQKLPETLILWSESPDKENGNLDPYHVPSDFENKDLG